MAGKSVRPVGSSFDARFGALMRSGGVAAVPACLIDYQARLGLSPGEMWFLVVLLRHRYTVAAPYPSIHRVSERTGVPRGTIHGYQDSLEAKGLLGVIPRVDDTGRRTSSEFNLDPLFDRLVALIEADEAEVGGGPDIDRGQPAHRPSTAGPPALDSRPTGPHGIDPEELESKESDLSLQSSQKAQTRPAEREKNQNLSRTTESPPTPLPAQAPPPIADPLTAAIAALYHTPEHPATPSMLSVYRGIAGELRDAGVTAEQLRPYHDAILASHTDWTVVQPGQLAKHLYLLASLSRTPRGSPPVYTAPVPESYPDTWRPPNAAPVPVPPQPDEEQHGEPVAPERAEELLANLRAMVGRLRADDRPSRPRVVDSTGVTRLATLEERAALERSRTEFLRQADLVRAEEDARARAPRLQEVPR